MKEAVTWILDIGNTRVKLAEFIGSKLKSVWQDEAAWEQACSLELNQNSDGFLVAATGQINEHWTGWIVQLLASGEGQHNRIHLTSCEDIPFDLPVSYATPSTLGLDRLANFFGALTIDPHSDWVVIDAGTCLTVDLVQNGLFCGGSIAPGMDLRLRAMYAGTANLPYPENWRQRAEGGLSLHVGSDTETSLLAGAVGGVIAELNDRLRCFQAEIGDLKVALTGGDAKFLELQADLPIFADPNLTWLGYFHLHQRITR